MAVPKRRMSRSNTRSRRSQWKTTAPTLVACSNRACRSHEAAARGLPDLWAVRRPPGRQPGLTARGGAMPRAGAAADRGLTAEPLLASLGVELDDELLTLALTHRSYAYENGGLPTNERLEFLGDSVLGDRRHRTPVPRPPGPARGPAGQAAGQRRQHARAGRRGRHLGESGSARYLLLGRGEELTGGRDKASILADAMEAADRRGLPGARPRRAPASSCTGCSTRCSRDAPLLGAGLDWKTSLQELTAAGDLGVPEYRVAEEGPDHRKDVHRHGCGRAAGTSARATAAPRRRPSRRRPSSPGAPSTAEARQHRGGADGTASAGRPRVPELPEVEVVRRGLAEHVVGRTIADGRGRATRARSAGTCAGAADFAGRLAGRTVTGVRRRGKYLWLALDGGAAGDDAVLAHLGMSGQMLVSRAGSARREAPAGPASASPTTGRSCGSSTSARSAGCLHPLVDAVGGGLAARAGRAHRPRPAGPARSTWTPPWPRIRRRRTEIKRALLDQTVVSGHRQHLRRRGAVAGPAALAPGPTETLTRRAGRAVLDRRDRGDGRGARRGRHVVRRAVRQRQRRSPATSTARSTVYGQAEPPVPAAAARPIRREAFMNRSSFSCPRCQPRPRGVRASPAS